MDKLVYAQANLITKNVNTWNTRRSAVLVAFDNVSGVVSDVTDAEFLNMLASMRSTLDQYFDSQVAPLTKQFEAL